MYAQEEKNKKKTRQLKKQKPVSETVIQRWAGHEHRRFGERAAGIVSKNNSLTADFGEFNEVAGDYAKTPSDIQKGGSEGLLNKLKMIWIAATNVNHFYPMAGREWANHHTKAMAMAMESQKMKNPAARDGIMEAALKEEAFACHFLQDSYASGHQYPRALLPLRKGPINFIIEAKNSRNYHDLLCALPKGLPLKEGRFHGDNLAGPQDDAMLIYQTANSLNEVFAAGGLTDMKRDAPAPSAGPDVGAIMQDEEAAPIWKNMMGHIEKRVEGQEDKNGFEEFSTDGGTEFTRNEVLFSAGSLTEVPAAAAAGAAGGAVRPAGRKVH